MVNFDDFIYNKARVPVDANEKNEFFKKLKQQFHDEIANSDVAKEYFKQFNPFSVSTFINSFANHKVSLARSYDYYEQLYNESEALELGFQNKAEDMLKLILQKKLFNMQLLWRAGKLNLEGIAVAYDFQFWESHITSCPFIPPIEEHEVEIMREFLLHSDVEDVADDYSFCSWQDYDSIMEKNADGLPDEMPAWYDFYDMRMGTGSYLILPNLKGAKEDYYLEQNREAMRRDNPPKTDAAPFDSRPHLYGFEEELTKFANSFETDAYFIELFKYYNYVMSKKNRLSDDFPLSNAIETLSSADRPIYLSGYLEWNEAIISAANKYTATKTAEALDSAYENYKMMKDLGISGNQTNGEINELMIKDSICQLIHKSILNGRSYCGEPANFNY